MSYKSGFVAILGRPNVGKSTLVNQILKQKVAIISDKVQTTRRRIRGIYTEERGQIIFVDTPGVHKPINRLGEFLMDEVKLAIPDSDLVLFVVDGTDFPGYGDKWIVEHVLKADIPVIMVINKADTIKDNKRREEIAAAYKDLFEEKKVPSLILSAKTGRNIKDLLKNIFRKLPKGPQYFPEEDLTDQSMRVISEEIIREKLLINTVEEIPHSIAVVIDKFESLQDITNIYATVYVERDSQKGIVIGKNGEMLKKVGTLARKEIEKMMDSKVYLDLNVKLKKDWRKNSHAVKQFGYRPEDQG